MFSSITERNFNNTEENITLKTTSDELAIKCVLNYILGLWWPNQRQKLKEVVSSYYTKCILGGLCSNNTSVLLKICIYWEAEKEVERGDGGRVLLPLPKCNLQSGFGWSLKLVVSNTSCGREGSSYVRYKVCLPCSTLAGSWNQKPDLKTELMHYDMIHDVLAAKLMPILNAVCWVRTVEQTQERC